MARKHTRRRKDSRVRARTSRPKGVKKLYGGQQDYGYENEYEYDKYDEKVGRNANDEKVESEIEFFKDRMYKAMTKVPDFGLIRGQ